MAFPYSLFTKICKHRGMDRAVAFFSDNDAFTLKQFVEKTGLTRGVAQLILRDMVLTEHLEKKGRRYFCSERLRGRTLIVNVRDIRSEVFFKRKGMRELLFWLSVGEKRLSEVAIKARTSVRTLKRATKELRESGIISDLTINPKVLWAASNPLGMVPRKEHALILGNFISLAEDQGPIGCPLVFFGDASWGNPSLTLKIMALFKIGPGIGSHVDVMERLVLASKTITSTYGVSVDLAFSATEAWLLQKLKITTSEHPLLNEAFSGICIHGMLPKEEEYFELLRQTVPFPKEKIKDWLAERYIEQVENKYVLAKKGVEMMRKRAPSDLIQGRIPVFDKGVPFITVKPAYRGLN